jgi:hypothetical protein
MKTHGFSYEGSSVFIREPMSLQLRTHLCFFAKLVNLSGKSAKHAHHHKLHSPWLYPQKQSIPHPRISGNTYYNAV